MVAMPASWLLLQQEGYLIRSSLFLGLNALRAATVADKGQCYTAFFQLSISLERLLKTILVIHHMANNAMAAPTKHYLMSLGHKLDELFSRVKGLSFGKSVNPLVNDGVKIGSIEHDILGLLTTFARSTRYFNLNGLSESQSDLDPLKAWGAILSRIVGEHVPASTRRRVQLEADYAATQANGSIIWHDLEHQQLTFRTAFSQSKTQPIATRHAVWHAIQLFLPLLPCLDMATDMARTTDPESVPDMLEFFAGLDRGRKEIMRKRRWP